MYTVRNNKGIVVGRFATRAAAERACSPSSRRYQVRSPTANFQKLQYQMQADLDTFEMAWGRYSRDPVQNKHKLDDAMKYMKDLRDLADVLIRNMAALKSG
jgi:hypothetical protein